MFIDIADKTKNGFFTFWAFSPNNKKQGKPKVYKTKYVEIPEGWVKVKEYAEYWELNLETVNTAIQSKKIPYILCRRNRYVELKNEYVLFENKLKYLDKQYDLEKLFKKSKKINLAANKLDIPVGTARNMLKEFRTCNPEYFEYSQHYRKPLNKREDFITLVESGESVTSIANKLNIAVSTVYKYKALVKIVTVPKGWVSVRTYSLYYGLNEGTIQSAICEGKIPCVRSKNKRYIELANKYVPLYARKKNQ